MTRGGLVLGLAVAGWWAAAGCGPSPAAGTAARLDPSPLRVLGGGDLDAWVLDATDAGGVAVRFTSTRSDSAAVYDLGAVSAGARPAVRVEPAAPAAGRPCPLVAGPEAGAALYRLGLSGTPEDAVDWEGRPTDGGRFVAEAAVSPAGDALALLVTDVAPEPEAMAPLRYDGPFAHEVYRLPDLRRVVGPTPVTLAGDRSPYWRACWSPSGAAVVYVSAAGHAVALTPGAPH